MADKKFDIIAKEQFSFLEFEYNFKLSKCDKEDWGYQLIYVNDTTGVKITYKYREAYVFIMLYQLIDDIITLGNSEDLVKPAYEYGEQSKYYDKDEGLSLYTAAFMNNLKTYGKDVLSGDFEIFPELDKIVKERVRSYKQ